MDEFTLSDWDDDLLSKVENFLFTEPEEEEADNVFLPFISEDLIKTVVKNVEPVVVNMDKVAVDDKKRRRKVLPRNNQNFQT